MAVDNKKKNDIIAKVKNPNTKEAVLKQLSNTNDYDIISAIISNPNCPGYILKREFLYLSEIYTSTPSQYSIIMHPNCPLEDITGFYLRYTDSIHGIHKNKLSEVNNMLDKLITIAKDPNCPQKALADFKDLRKRVDTLHFDSKVSSFYVNELNKKEKILIRLAARKMAKRKFKDKVLDTVSEKEVSNYKNSEIDKVKEEKHNQTNPEEIRNQIINNLKQIKLLMDELNSKGIEITNIPRLSIPKEELLIDAVDHIEINPYYLQYIDYIDFSQIDSSNLKISGVDISKTNIGTDSKKIK